ncbi:MAG: nucleotidyltransferase family protein [Gemmatimonadota bacterium]
MKPAALVLAAGMSTRISSLAGVRPKPLLQVAGETLLGWNLRLLAATGIEDVWINVHYRAEDIVAVIGDGSRYGLNVRYSHEAELLGTAGGWKRVAGMHAGRWLIVYGDNLTRMDLRRFVARHESGTVLIALFDAARNPNTGSRGGHASVKADRITAFVEGGPGNSGGLVNAGVYILDAALAGDIADGFADFGRDVFPGWAEAGLLRPHLLSHHEFCLGLDTPEHFAIGANLIAAGQVAL